MSDIFISYARSTARQAEQVEVALKALGYSVWRDDELPAHLTFAEVIEENLRAAKAVVVVWSAEAVKSQWVRAEANVARRSRTLVQLSVDGTPPPLPFSEIQCLDLTGWTGDPDLHDWKKVVASVSDLVGGAQPTAAVSTATPRRLSVCVLPFANMSGDSEQEYFSDGISEDVITDLSKVSALSVVARNTAFTFKGKSVDVPQVARQLGVSHLLEGSVRKADGRVRITAQLVDGAAGDHIWAERWDRDLTDIFALQGEISQAIVKALKLKLLPPEQQAIERRGTNNVEAYDLYLMARSYALTGNGGDRRDAETIVRLCDRAVYIDPGYSRAWALMAGAQFALHHSFGRASEDGQAALNRALALDPDLAEARSLKARMLSNAGQQDAALAEIAVALRLDPESYEVNKRAGHISYAQGRLKDAAQHWEKAAGLIETDLFALQMLISCYTALRDGENTQRVARVALSRAERAIAQDPNDLSAMDVGVAALAALGETEKAKNWMNRALLINPDDLVIRYNFACALSVWLNDPEAALNMLGPVLERDNGRLVSALRSDPDAASLRDEPRLHDMIATAEARVAAAGSSESA